LAGKQNSKVLVISDQHFPYNHPDLIAFLKALDAKYKFDRVINIGDELDFHAISFHTHDPELLAPSDELKAAIARIKPLYELFPEMDLIESNHGSLVYRKGKFHGLPRHVFKSYREILGAPQGWKWHRDLTIKLPDGNYCYFHHGMSGKPGELSRRRSMCTVEGHFHSKFDITYWGNSRGLYWAMHVSCLIDDDSLAYAYNKTTIERPIIGCGSIIDSHPKLHPMILDKSGRWIGRLL
jgi:hypothetical protein